MKLQKLVITQEEYDAIKTIIKDHGMIEQEATIRQINLANEVFDAFDEDDKQEIEE